jgi:probable rRNA maturation factor
MVGSQVEVINRQKRRAIDYKKWRSFAEKALNEISKDGLGVTIVFVSDRGIQRLNKLYRGRNKATDVLSFPAGLEEDFERLSEPALLGDVVISIERAEEQSLENGLDFEIEVAQLILHGLLHLHGYDHETDNGEMNRLELRLRRRLGI